jgi:hypothetical protein
LVANGTTDQDATIAVFLEQNTELFRGILVTLGSGPVELTEDALTFMAIGTCCQQNHSWVDLLNDLAGSINRPGECIIASAWRNIEVECEFIGVMQFTLALGRLVLG